MYTNSTVFFEEGVNLNSMKKESVSSSEHGVPTPSSRPNQQPQLGEGRSHSAVKLFSSSLASQTLS